MLRSVWRGIVGPRGALGHWVRQCSTTEELAIAEKIRAQLVGSNVKVQDTSGGCGTMFSIDVVSAEFSPWGKSSVLLDIPTSTSTRKGKIQVPQTVPSRCPGAIYRRALRSRVARVDQWVGCARICSAIPRSIVCNAKKSKESESTSFRLPWDPLPSAPVKKYPDPEEDPETWGFFDWGSYAEKWEVPWGCGSIALGMGVWLVSSILLGLTVVPQALKLAGVSSLTVLTPQQQSFFLLEAQALETVAGLAVIYLTVRPYMPLPDDLFKYSIEGPFRKPRGWVLWAILGLIACIATNASIVSLMSFAGIEEASGPGTATAVAGIVNADWVTYGSLLIVVGVLAPALEETVFRGFLLTSLTKYMPTPLAVVLSGVAFGLAHLSPRDFPYLTAVGIVWGFVYVKSRNLLTPMLMHCIWNSSVISILFILVAAGVDIKELV